MGRQLTQDELDTLRKDIREGSDRIREQYQKAIDAVAQLGKVLRTEQTAIWSAEHKTSISGIKAVLTLLRDDVPKYSIGAVTN